MKDLFKMICAVFSVIIMVCPCLSQSNNYDGPEENELFRIDENISYYVIGWSKDGRRIAYGTYKDFQSPVSDERFRSMAMIIHDLVKDSTITVIAQDWSSPNSDFPESPKQAWLYVNQSSAINEEIQHYGIEVSPPGGISDEVSGNRITLENDLLTVDIRVFESENGYSKKFEVHVSSEKLGGKIITSGEISLYREGITLEGFVLNPDKSRAAIFLGIHGGAEYEPEYFVAGCHLRAGFVVTEK
jgi:hypothetical protein